MRCSVRKDWQLDPKTRMDKDTWWYKDGQKKTDNVIYGHGTDIPGALQIASAGKLESSSGTCRNGVYHVGAPANLTALQAIEHLWEATHTTGANGGALVLSTMEGVLVVQRWSEGNGQRDLRPWYRHTFSSRRLCGKRALALMETCVVVVCLLLIVHSPLLCCRERQRVDSFRSGVHSLPVSSCCFLGLHHHFSLVCIRSLFVIARQLSEVCIA